MPVPELDEPFALFEASAAGGGARLFTGLRESISATAGCEIRSALDRLRSSAGHRAGFIGFDAGYVLEPALADRRHDAGDGLPLLWFGIFDHVAEVDPTDVLGAEACVVGALYPAIEEEDYSACVAAVLDRIAAGDLYQANLTFQASVTITGSPLALYRQIRTAAAAPFGALINTGSAHLLSFSPELFFELHAGKVTTRPMKGTALRGDTPEADDAAALALAADPKNRAENLMIVDLLRNDLARIAEPGSVRVDELFTVERYPTLLQMTSTITATTDHDAVTVLTGLSPSGSVTGAPKIAAMKAIADLESAGRGVYTGSIGFIDDRGHAVFNVAIRTLIMTSGRQARIGIGAGIVADSVPADEWRECLAKAAFLHRGTPTHIIETMRLDEGAIDNLARHLDRAAATASFLGYRFDREAVSAAIHAAAAAARSSRLRLAIDHCGSSVIELSPLPARPSGCVSVRVVSLPVDARDWRLRHKTTDRAFYDDARRSTEAFEVVFATPDGVITEGSFTNIFVPAPNGILLTPPLSIGLLPGILRATLLDDGRAVEATVRLNDLTSMFFVGNAVRGLMPATLAA